MLRCERASRRAAGVPPLETEVEQHLRSHRSVAVVGHALGFL
jgi:hypothetical protein